MVPTKILNKAADLLDRPNGWTQGFYARNAAGVCVSELSSKAVCFCAAGAIHVAAEKLGEWGSAGEAVDLFKAHIERLVGHPSIARWNDAPGRTQAEVVAALRAAALKSGSAE